VVVGCDQGMFVGDELCVQVVMKDHSTLKFERVGAKSFGPDATNVFISEAGGLVPRVASCQGIALPNLHRGESVGRHFRSNLTDVKFAVERHRRVIQDLEYWPQCPQFWEGQDSQGADYRYCARKSNATEEPPKPENCK